MIETTAGPGLDPLADAFKALGHPQRLKIVLALLRRRIQCCTGDRIEDCTLDPASCNVGELLAEVDVSAPTLSHHLKELDRVGLIERGREGRYLYTRVNGARLREILRVLALDEWG